MNIVVSEKKTGKAINMKTEKPVFVGREMGQEIDLGSIGLSGYRGKISGGSDKDGFPMKHGIHGMLRRKVILEKGVGLRGKKKGMKVKKTVAGNTVTQSTAQLNIVVVSYGQQEFAELAKTLSKPGEEKQASAKERLIKESLEKAGSEELAHEKVKGKVKA